MQTNLLKPKAIHVEPLGNAKYVEFVTLADPEALRAQLQGTGVSVTRVGDQIILNMPSNITFATDSAEIVSNF